MRPFLGPTLVVIALALCGPLVEQLRQSHQDLLITVLLYAFWATAWNILGGMAGQLSFGHAIFIGVGAYTSSILFVHFGVNPWLGMFVGAAFAAAIGLFIGYVSFRYGLRDVYFSLTTLAFAEIVFLLVGNTDYHGLFGGQGGVRFPVVEPSPLIFQFASKVGYYYVVATLLAVALALTWWIRRSRLGYYLIAIRENERTAQAIGINITRYKLVAVAVSAALTALGGTFYAQYYLFIDPPSVLHSSLSIAVLLPAIVGGMNTRLGPLVGAFILIPVSEQLRTMLSGGVAGGHLVVYSLVIILVMLFIPQGLVGWIAGRSGARPRTSTDGTSHRSALMPNAPMLEVENVTKTFGGLAAVRNLSFGVERGEIVGIIGPNGAGKTTTFEIITGFQAPTEGQVRFKGEPIAGLRPYETARRGLGRTFQIPQPFPSFTVLDNIMAAAFMHRPSRPKAEQKARAVLERVGMAARADVLAKNLTLADTKRLEIARALAIDAELILLDEVMAGLTAVEADDAIALLLSLNRNDGLTFLVIEHIMQIIMSISQRIVVLHHGEKIAEGTPDQVSQDARVIESYLGEESFLA